MKVVRCLLRAGVGGQAFTAEPEIGPLRLDPARPAISDGGPPRCVRPGSTFSFLKAVSVELLSTTGQRRIKANGQRLWANYETLQAAVHLRNDKRTTMHAISAEMFDLSASHQWASGTCASQFVPHW